MQFQTVAILSCLAVTIIAILYAMYRVYNMQKPAPGNCDVTKQLNPNVNWSPDCSYVQELKANSSIPTPNAPLYISSFTNSPGSGPAWGANVWYRYRFINGKGEYGNFSPWTPTSIIAGSNNLPCKNAASNDNTCASSFKSMGKDSCQSNLPTLNLDNISQVTLTNNMYINVHRYVSNNTIPPSDTTNDRIVGVMIPKDNNGNFMFIDTSSSPCKEASCNNIQGC